MTFFNYASWRSIILKTKNYDLELTEGLNSFINPHSMLLLKNEAIIAEKIDNWYVDGISLVRFFNFFSLKKKLKRFSFDETSIAPIVFQGISQGQLKCAIIGTKKELLLEAVSNINKKHNVIISYYRDGYLRDEKEYFETIDKIIQLKIEVVICGMGTPIQEKFLIDLRERGWKGCGFTCGGYLHQSADSMNYYPKIFNKLNIRWIYRIIDEPKLLSRYLIRYPKFYIKFFIFYYTSNDCNKDKTKTNSA